MWTTESRARHDRSKLRFPSDLTDDEWVLIAPLIPTAKRGRLPRRHNDRDLINGLMYVLSTGCQWRYIPKDLPPRITLHDYLTRWNYDGTLMKIHHELYVKCREQAGRYIAPPTLRIPPAMPRRWWSPPR